MSTTRATIRGHTDVSEPQRKTREANFDEDFAEWYARCLVRIVDDRLREEPRAAKAATIERREAV